MNRFTTIIALFVASVFLTQSGFEAAAADGQPAGKRQHKPYAITTELQAALENASSIPDLQGIVVLCADACKPQAKFSNVTLKRGVIAEPGGGGTAARKGDVTLKRGVIGASGAASSETQQRLAADTPLPFRCVGQKCSCTGPDACVEMVAEKKVCKLGTVKCTARSCSCNKGGARAR